MKAIKGFRPDLTCDPTGSNPFQFVEGETYDLGQSAIVCKRGFHAVTMPLDVFAYYPPAGSVFHEVEVDDDAKTHSQDSKVASRRIKIGARIDIAGLVKAQVSAVWERCTLEPGSAATGDRGAASATGDQGAASATGDRGAASATGYQGAASATGDRGAASATGDRGAASATGYRGAASATGYRGAASATGYQGAASATGYQGAASATGDQGAASATGDQGAASATGKDATAAALGWKCRASGSDGTWLALVERVYDPATGAFPIVGKPVWVQVGSKHKGRVIKPDVFYGLVGGAVVEVDEFGEAIA